MADVPISYFKAVRSSGKFQPSNPPDLETPPPVINPPGSGGGVNLFKSLGDVTDRSFIGKNGYVPVVTAENLLSLQPLPQVPDNGLISGGIVQWTGTGYVFNVSSCFYRISGEPYSTDPTQKTLSTPDVTNNRIDVFAVDINSLVVVIEGTPSATPVKPQIDPSTQIELTSVIVTASSTEPTLTEEIIYDENIEWTGTSAGTGTVSFNSAVDPFEGTVSIETTDIQNGFIVKLTNSIDVDISTFQTLGFQLNLKASMPSNQNLYGLFINSVGDAVSNKFLLNFDKSLSGSYQFIGIALNTLSFTSNDIRAIYFSFERLAGSPTYSGFFLDVVRLEGGINPPVNVGNHNSLQGLQGGTANEYYHLSNSDYNKVVAFSPYSLAQEGASDGQVLTWVAANSRYEPTTVAGGSSPWTTVTDGIYRDGNVLVGGTTFTSSGGGGEFATFQVKSKVSGAAGSILFGTFTKSGGENVIEFRQSSNPIGLISYSANESVTIGNITSFSGGRGLIIRPNSAGQSIICTDTAGTSAYYYVDANGISYQRYLLVNTTTLNSWGSRIRGFGNNNAGRISLIVERSTGTMDFQVRSNGYVDMPNLPTASTGIAGVLWNDAGTLKIG